MRKTWNVVAVVALALLIGGAATAAEMVLTDPTGDDDGPGGYIYPTDQVYTPGSFDLTELKVEDKGGKIDVEVSVAAALDDPWRMGTGFAVQMVFVFIDTDGEAGGGHTMAPPGLNVQFAEGSEWDACIILSPQSSSRVKQEVRTKAGDMADDIIVPNRVTGRGKTISASVKTKEIGDGDPSSWGWQVVMQSNEGFPAKGDLLTRKVNEFEGQHRFGGGSDYDCDPHVMDVLAGEAMGKPEEVDAQHEMLSYECDDEGNAAEMATLEMVRR